jgi:SAM-dependent methyltransferase
MYRECFRLIEELDASRLRVLEISPGSNRIWSRCGFKSIQYVDYPEFDFCNDRVEETSDLIIADQVFEHLLWLYRVGKNVYRMLVPGGHFLVTTPFLVRVHASGEAIPFDCSQWTELGLRHFLAECGFSMEGMKSGSWRNRQAVVGNFKAWVRPVWWRRMHNEPDFPVTLCVLAMN